MCVGVCVCVCVCVWVCVYNYKYSFVFFFQTSLYPYVCKRMAYPVGHPKVLIGSELSNYNIKDLEGMVKCTILPPRNMYLPLLPSKINGKLMFTLCRKCTEVNQQSPCTHSRTERALTGVWITDEVKKAVSIGYCILHIHEAWHFNETTKFNQENGTGGLFPAYMDTFLE